MLIRVYFFGLLAVARATIDKTFIIELAPESSLSGRSTGPHKAFHKRAESLDYVVRHEFNSPDTYVGLSLEVRSAGTNEEVKAQLRALPGVLSVSQVRQMSLPFQANTSVDPLLSFSNTAPLKKVAAAGTGNLAAPLQMGGIDKLHDLGIKGKGIKIGIVDTGVDYRHPALGGGFGPGYKIAGGWAFCADNGTSISDPDPLTTCYGGGHGTHVAGLIGMESVGAGFDIVGVAPEATLFVYKALSCFGHGGSDDIMAGMLKAQEDGVDIISMSIGGAGQAFNGEVDPYEALIQKLTDAGIAVIVANANNNNRGATQSQALYSVNSPASVHAAIGVGAMANSDFPIVYSAVDSVGSTLKFGSVWPIELPKGADVYMMENGCNGNDWVDALNAVTDLNNTIFAFPIGGYGALCSYDSVGGWSSNTKKTPVYIAGYNLPNTDPYWQVYDVPSQGYYGTVHWIDLNAEDGATFAANYEAAGGYLKYKWTFPSKTFESPQQASGGFMDYYSSWGPGWHDYNLKPQISAPGGHTLSTWPLGDLGGYTILSGTSMATPYVSGAYALIKSQYPHIKKVSELLNIIQTTAKPLPWIYDTSIVAGTQQQGAGQINAYDAIFSSSTVSPGQIIIDDVNHRNYGSSKVVIKNASKKSKTYTLSHQGAAYSNYRNNNGEKSQQAKYGSATFEKTEITLAPGKSSSVAFTISPPSDVDPSRIPVFGGFIKVADTDGEDFTVPYTGPPFSPYNLQYLSITTSGFIFPGIYGVNKTTGSNEYVSLKGYIEIDPTLGWGYVYNTNYWTTHVRVDLVPANTKLKADHYGFDTSVKSFPAYQASSTTPTSSIFGQPSYGTIYSAPANTYNWAGGRSNSQKTSVVTADDGSKVTIGKGDVRFYISILRQGGEVGVAKDYETYLGPIIRFV